MRKRFLLFDSTQNDPYELYIQKNKKLGSMGKIFSNLLRNITALRVICVAVSLLFIPAFQYGFVSIWAPVFGVLMALLFDRHLQKIIDICEPIEDKAKRRKIVFDKYILSITEVAMIGSLGVILISYINLEANHIVNLPDIILMNISPFSTFGEENYSQNSLVIKKFQGLALAVLFFIIAASFLGFKAICKCAVFVIFVNDPDPDYKLHRWNQWVYTDLCGAFSLLMVLLVNSPFYLGDTFHFYHNFEPYIYPAFYCVKLITLTVLVSCYASFIHQSKESRPSHDRK